MRVLCVAEKPSISKAIARALSGGDYTVRSSPNKYIKNYDLSYTFPQWGPCSVTVTSVLGHVTDVQFPEAYNDWNRDAATLFSAPVQIKVLKDMENVVQNIGSESRKANKLYIWTDCDREGEHIGSEISEQATKTNRSIDIFRAHFNNTEPSHIKQAAGQPHRLDQHLVEAVSARRELDLRTGLSMTRFQTRLFKQRFAELRDGPPISYGACQFPTLGFVVDRYRKVKGHIPEKFFAIDLNVMQDKTRVSFLWDRTRLFDRMSALCFYERALTAGGSEAIVKRVTRKPQSQYKPLPLTTVKLQKLGSKFLKMNSKRVMDIAENLYNQGFISYPRTETDSFDDSINLKNLVQRLTSQNELGSYAQKLIDGAYVAPRKGKNDDKAHPPIHPVTAAQRSAMASADHFKVYEFVCRHFLACCSDDAKGDQTVVELAYGEEGFHTKSVIVRELNYLEVYIYAKWTSLVIPEFEEGSTVKVTSANLREGKTSPPDFLTEPELISLMDANGIGTDATMAEHIQKIKDREFVVVVKNKFVPTTLGLALVEGYDSIGLERSLTKPVLRRETEENLKRICNGSVQRAAIMGQMIREYEAMHKLAHDNRSKLTEVAAKYLVAAS